MSTEPRRLIDQGPDDLRELLESAQLDEPTAAQLERLTLKVSFLFPILPGGGGDGGGGHGGGDHGGGDHGGDGAGGHVPGGGAAGGGHALGGGAAGAGGGAVSGAVGGGAGATSIGAAGVGAGAAAGKAGLTVASLKTAAIVLAASVAVGGGGVAAVRSVTQRAVEPVVQRIDPPVVKPPEPVVEASPEAPVVEAAEPVREPPKRPPPAPKVVEPSEDALMAEALALARSGNAAAALTKAEQLAARYPSGMMVQEREVIAIEALMNLGRVAEARARATTFRQQWPTSAHITKVDALVHTGE